ncbi:MAG TPA: alpha/beta hydrolase [Planctomycetaceae bacterium]|nr:alpha/beta hydrolase [Planctomycetaceae bacterium]
MRLAVAAFIAFLAQAQELPATETIVRKDIEYAIVGEHRLLLDLHVPATEGPHPLVVWVHGGAWRSGSKDAMPLGALVELGYAIASVDYRLSPVAPFPAQVHDIKAAIRFLRASHEKYGLKTGKIAIAGASAGGHLAALVGVTNGLEPLEGTVGEHLDQSSDIAAIIDMYGPANFLTILGQSTPHGLGVRIPALQLLLRKQPEDDPALARLASPVFHIDKDDPPLLLIHGVQDPQVPISQSLELHGAYRQKGRPVHLHMIYDGLHGGPQFTDKERIDLMAQLLDPILSPPIP